MQGPVVVAALLVAGKRENESICNATVVSRAEVAAKSVSTDLEIQMKRLAGGTDVWVSFPAALQLPSNLFFVFRGVRW